MKKSDIFVGGTYTNGKGRIRRIVAEGAFFLYPGQMDNDCIEYQIVHDGTKKNRLEGRYANMTRASFAVWAKERIEEGQNA